MKYTSSRPFKLTYSLFIPPHPILVLVSLTSLPPHSLLSLHLSFTSLPFLARPFIFPSVFCCSLLFPPSHCPPLHALSNFLSSSQLSFQFSPHLTFFFNFHPSLSFFRFIPLSTPSPCLPRSSVRARQRQLWPRSWQSRPKGFCVLVMCHPQCGPWPNWSSCWTSSSGTSPRGARTAPPAASPRYCNRRLNPMCSE